MLDNLEVFAIVAHVGETLKDGHYVCYRHEYKDKWKNFDGNFEEEITFEGPTIDFGKTLSPFLVFLRSASKHEDIADPAILSGLVLPTGNYYVPKEIREKREKIYRKEIENLERKKVLLK